MDILNVKRGSVARALKERAGAMLPATG